MPEGKEKNVGRPSKFTEKTKERILYCLKNGSDYNGAAVLSGVSRTIFYDWRRKGAEDREAFESGEIEEETPFSIFLNDIERAKEDYIQSLIQKVNRHTAIDGKLALSVLERLRPERFGRKDKLDLNMPQPLTIQVITSESEEDDDNKNTEITECED